MNFDIDYEPDGPVLKAFMRSNAHAKFICGPFRSGKTVGCAVEIFRRSCEQAPDAKGGRKTRWLVVRSTYPQLKNTTIPSWTQWFDNRFGVFNWGPPPVHRLILPLDDGTVVDMDVRFVALDGPDAEENLRGFEGTGVWFNELREIPKGIITFARGRVGQYPSMRDGGCTWYGVIGDTNPPDSDSWYYRFAEEDTPEGWEFYKQPGGVIKVGGEWVDNPDRENGKHIAADYYTSQVSAQTEDFTKVFLAGEYGYVVEGKAVYPEYVDTTHCAPEALAPVEGLKILVGLDFGLTPAAVLGQQTPTAQWRIIDELCAEDMGAVRFSGLLSSRLAQWYPGFEVECWGDPAGNTRAQTDEQTCFEIVEKHAGLKVRPAPSNDWTLRREGVVAALDRMRDGKPGFQLSPFCKMLRKGFTGGFHYNRVRVAGDERFHDKPDKNAFSHPHDALQYLMSGGGEGRAVLHRHKKASAPAQTKTDNTYRIYQ